MSFTFRTYALHQKGIIEGKRRENEKAGEFSDQEYTYKRKSSMVFNAL